MHHRPTARHLIVAVIVLVFGISTSSAQTVLVEAESFQDHGGWVVDQQSMDQMGSPFLLAHGLGTPVDDATTVVQIPAAGEYRVLVRTRDWVAPWKVPGAPGKFQLLVDGKALPTTFGIEGAEWHWQDGGTVRLAGGSVRLALDDVTGFAGRCDAIVLTTDPDFAPPNDDPAMAAFRRTTLGFGPEPTDAGEFDFVVVGGGMAGTCAAVSAARLGLKVALIQDRPLLGGNNSSEVRVHLQGKINLPPYPALGNLVREIGPRYQGNARPAKYYQDEKKLETVAAEESLHLFLNTRVFQAEMKADRINAVIGRDTRSGKELRFRAPLFADCTGDGTLGYLAGAYFRMGRESRSETGESLAPEQGDKMTMGASVQWYSEKVEEPVSFPECPWAVQFNQESYQKATMGEWNWETGMNRDQITEIEQIRDYAFRVVYGNWSFLKNHSPEKDQLADRRLAWVAYVAGKRESRRLQGDVVLQQQDIESQRQFPDGCVTTTWHIDLHYPDPENTKHFPGEEFRSIAKFHPIKPYAIPYRAMYSSNIANLFMAGRNISVTHAALGTIRVMRTGGMMGEVVGMAASLCKRHDTQPRGIYEQYLDELKALMTQGVGAPAPEPTISQPPAWLTSAGESLARKAKVTVSGNYDLKQYPVANINDGRYDPQNNALRWVSDTNLPCSIEFEWDEPQTINAARIISGQRGDLYPETPITDFVLQVFDGSKWRDIPETETAANADYDWHARFPEVSTKRARLLVEETPGGLARIWEIEFYRLRQSRQ